MRAPSALEGWDAPVKFSDLARAFLMMGTKQMMYADILEVFNDVHLHNYRPVLGRASASSVNDVHVCYDVQSCIRESVTELR